MIHRSRSHIRGEAARAGKGERGADAQILVIGRADGFADGGEPAGGIAYHHRTSGDTVEFHVVEAEGAGRQIRPAESGGHAAQGLQRHRPAAAGTDRGGGINIHAVGDQGDRAAIGRGRDRAAIHIDDRSVEIAPGEDSRDLDVATAGGDRTSHPHGFVVVPAHRTVGSLHRHGAAAARRHRARHKHAIFASRRPRHCRGSHADDLHVATAGGDGAIEYDPRIGSPGARSASSIEGHRPGAAGGYLGAGIDLHAKIVARGSRSAAKAGDLYIAAEGSDRRASIHEINPMV